MPRVLYISFFFQYYDQLGMKYIIVADTRESHPSIFHSINFCFLSSSHLKQRVQFSLDLAIFHDDMCLREFNWLVPGYRCDNNTIWD